MSDSGTLPSGDVTFVFTDIEGSTLLMRRLGDDDYRTVLHQHRVLLRRVWERHNGAEVETEGDSFLVAFSDPVAAVEACLSAHACVAADPDLAAVGLRVRAGMHRGTAQPVGEEYVSVAVARAARIASAANGGQTLLSPAAAHPVRQRRDLGVRPLGIFDIRDFAPLGEARAPLEIFAADPAGDSGPEPRLDRAKRHNLPALPGVFVGRERDISALDSVLDPAAVVTILGPGGVGKTRLAVEVGLRRVDQWSDGVGFVDLSVVAEGVHLGSAVVDALSCEVESGSAWEDAISHLESRNMLLVLDNCEHLFPESSLFAAQVAERCPGVGILATSRERLGVTGERTMTLAPLPTHHAGEDDLASALFCERLPIEPMPQEIGVIAEICELLDGLPLAIEIAAAHAGPVPVRDVLEVLKDSPDALHSLSPVTPERHRSMTAVLEWSLGLLSRAEMAVLRRISVLAGSFTVEAAEEAAGAGAVARSAVRSHLWALASKSLVQVVRSEEETRYRLLRTVRDHVARTGGEEDYAAARVRVGRWYLDRLGPEARDDVLRHGEVGVELDNIRELIVGASGLDEGDRQLLAWSVGRYFDVADQFRLGASEVRSYAKDLPAETPARVALLTLEADLRMRFGDVDVARSLVDEATFVADRVGVTPWDDGGLERAKGAVALYDGEYALARSIATEALRGEVSARGRARLYDLLGVAEGQLGNFEAAASALEAELALWERLGLDSYAATTLGNLAEAYLGLGRRTDAAASQLRCLDLAARLDQPVLVAFSLIVAAHLAGDEERWLDVAALQGAADKALDDAEYVLYPADVEARAGLLDRASAHGRAERIAGLLSDEARTPLPAAIDIARDVLGSGAEGE